MSMLDRIKNRTLIDVDFLIKRLAKELKVINEKKEEIPQDAEEQIICSLYDTLIIILDTTHQDKVPEGLYTTWLNMTKDYWYLNKYDTLFQNNNSETGSEDSNSNKKSIKSIQVGDTTTTFVDKSSQIEINGTIYNTGTINFDENILKEKYKSALYRHRKFRRPL